MNVGNAFTQIIPIVSQYGQILLEQIDVEIQYKICLPCTETRNLKHRMLCSIIGIRRATWMGLVPAHSLSMQNDLLWGAFMVCFLKVLDRQSLMAGDY